MLTPVMLKVVNAAVSKAYGDKRRIAWMEIYSGEKATRLYGQFLPDETLQALREYVVSIKGPLGTPIGGGIRFAQRGDEAEPRSLRVRAPDSLFPRRRASRCRTPSLTDMVVFRENTEDIYAGIEWPAASPEVQKLITYLAA